MSDPIITTMRESVGWRDTQLTYTYDELIDLFPDADGSIANALVRRCQTHEAVIAAQEKQIAELQAVVEKLPKTMDGAPITPGMSVWSRAGHVRGREPMEHFGTISEDGIIGSPRDYDGFTVLISECYSTREAALAGARKESP